MKKDRLKKVGKVIVIGATAAFIPVTAFGQDTTSSTDTTTTTMEASTLEAKALLESKFQVELLEHAYLAIKLPPTQIEKLLAEANLDWESVTIVIETDGEEAVNTDTDVFARRCPPTNGNIDVYARRCPPTNGHLKDTVEEEVPCAIVNEGTVRGVLYDNGQMVITLPPAFIAQLIEEAHLETDTATVVIDTLGEMQANTKIDVYARRCPPTDGACL